MEMEEKKSGMSQFAMPIAIVIAGALVAGAVMYSGGSNGGNQPTQEDSGVTLDAMAPITKADHIMGNPNADIVIVEYSDFECPFCKSFHVTMERIMDEYGADGTVAWVYRHFPLDSIHKKARIEAVAAECAAELGGNDAFWAYTNRFFEVSLTNDRTDIETAIPAVAKEVGLNEEKFLACLDSGKFDQHIQDNLDDAIATGGRGTPWSIVLLPGGEKTAISGAQPYESIKQLIEQYKK